MGKLTKGAKPMAKPAVKARTDREVRVEVFVKHLNEVVKQMNDYAIAVRKHLDMVHGSVKVANVETLAAIHREIACTRSDTLALLAMREGDGRRLSRLEIMIENLTKKSSGSITDGLIPIKPSKKKRKAS